MGNPNIEEFEIIIVGAGPAGLSVASELSKSHKVLLIEKGELCHTDRAWFVPGFIINKADDGVKKHVYNGVYRILENTPTLSIIWDVTSPWESDPEWKCYPYIDQNGMFNYWADLIKKNGSKTMEYCSFTDYDNQDGELTVRAIGTQPPYTNYTFKSKLLIDASGYNSPVANRSRVSRDNYYFWSVYGWELTFDTLEGLKHPSDLGDMLVGDFMLWNSFKTVPEDPDATLADFRPIMEYEVLDDKTIFFFILFFHQEIATKDFMRDQFNNIMKNTPEMKPYIHGEWTRERFGWYPSCGLSQQIAVDNISFVGDAGCWTLADGYGMGFIMNNYVEYSRNISHILKKGNLKAKELNKATVFNIRQKYQIILDQLVLNFMSYAPPHLLNKFTNSMFRYHKGLMIEKVFILQMSEKEAISLLLKMLREFKISELLRVVNNGMDKKLILKTGWYFLLSSWSVIWRKLLFRKQLEMGYAFQPMKGVKHD